jgi:hypothetical protein
VVQDRLLDYMQREFTFDHLVSARTSDPMHFHSYAMPVGKDGKHSLLLGSRLSTDSEGVARALGLQSEARVELEVIVSSIEKRVSDGTRFDFKQVPEAMRVDPQE